MSGSTAAKAGDRIIWDRLVRAFHWLLVATVLGALWTGFFGGPSTFDLHVVLGCAVTALIVIRIVWGFTGTTHARFRDFLATPAAVLRYVRDLLGGKAPAHAGHNPLGGLMILGLLLMLGGLIASGVTELGGLAKAGPLLAWTNYAIGTTAAALHRALAFGLAGMIVLHIAGVGLESLRTGENLVRAMITGRKRRLPEVGKPEAAHLPTTPRPMLAAGIVVALGAVAVPVIMHASGLPAPGVPSAALPAMYVKECGACHSVHHPSLAPIATWTGLLAGLGDHFGETASLSPEVAAGIQSYLQSNSAEHWDTVAAHRLAASSQQEPLRITATDGWRKIHSGIADVVFLSKAVAGKVNCGNCHGDASNGHFSRRAIRIPSDSLP